MMITELTAIASRLEAMVRVLLGDCLLRREEKEPDEEDRRGSREILRPFRQCLQSVEMNICVVGDRHFRSCLQKHSRPFFSRSTRGSLLNEEFVSIFSDILFSLGGGDGELGRMRLSLYQGEIEAALTEHLEKQLGKF
ncbi:hypothetical protein KAR29_07345 [Aminithiophilus ramosus]|uniref:Uncharacterized protein n=2 Tax=Synergistales TaxID=649776 RepID=A0A9Q7ACZ7_9BACT|nr:hypothetical protein [Aminithiophilus ramosus]QTX31219.1 hypothetical protein KAR29_07345 [Aminithiophilus ramosus]QVL37497.1 hypothetical protein KIH16_07190 [Synergistota bacterium]